MKIGMIGLGRMGGNMAERLRRHGHDVVGYDRDPGVRDVDSLEALAKTLDGEERRVAWSMVPAGAPTDETVAALGDLLSDGDLVVDGGNSNFRDSQRHAAELAERRIAFVDAGVSGGVWGLEAGYCIMAGGEASDIAFLRPVFDALVTEGGFAHVGPVGAGHFTKMIHNGVEYGLMQAYAEGYELLRRSGLGIDAAATLAAWRRGSVVRSWLLDLTVAALEQRPDLEGVAGVAQDSGEGRWMLQAAVDAGAWKTARPPVETNFSGLRTLRFRAEGKPRGWMLQLHGGGFRIGRPEFESLFAEVLVNRCGIEVVVPQYRLAPEGPFPAGLTDALAALTALRAEIGDAPLIVGGDSAGGGLAASLGVSSQTLGSGNSAVAACQAGTLTSSYATSYDAAIPGYKVGVVTVSGLESGCYSKAFKVTLTSTSDTSLAEVTGTTPSSGTSFTADFSAGNIPAASAAGIGAGGRPPGAMRLERTESEPDRAPWQPGRGATKKRGNPRRTAGPL